jgi:tRNA-specific 2-thiouridylase
LALRFDLPVAAKPDSQEICFVPQGRYADVVLKIRPDAAKAGDIVDLDGNVLGQHDGIIHYTIGQRRGLHLDAAEEALYVIRIDPEAKQVIVGPRDALAITTVHLNNVNWLGGEIADCKVIECEVKVRSMRPPVVASVRLLGDGSASVELAAAEHGVAPGQACVFYDGERVLGGGWIQREKPAIEAA